MSNKYTAPLFSVAQLTTVISIRSGEGYAYNVNILLLRILIIGVNCIVVFIVRHFVLIGRF